MPKKLNRSQKRGFNAARLFGKDSGDNLNSRERNVVARMVLGLDWEDLEDGTRRALLAANRDGQENRDG
jgi:hypothetical protein